MIDKETRTLPGPLVEWQIHRATHDFPGVQLRQQEAKVTEWLYRNHFKVTSTLPRLDPLILTSRGTDYNKFINFIYPAPFSLKFQSDRSRRRRRYSHEEEITNNKEPCPRLQRTKRNNTNFFTLNPVIRVGGGYKKLKWNTLEVLPAIGQIREDVTLAFMCTRCGVNLVVPQETTDNDGNNKLVVIYPSKCANCGKEVISPKNMRQQHSKPDNFGKHDHKSRETQDVSYLYYETSNIAKVQMGRRSENIYSDYSDDTGFSFTPDGKEDSFLITEADGSFKRIKKSITNSDVKDPLNNENKSRDEMVSSREIIEHRDPESGIKVRVRRKGGKNGDVGEESYYISKIEDENEKSGMKLQRREGSRKGSVTAHGDILREESDEEGDEIYSFLSRQSKKYRSFHNKKSRSRLTRCLENRNAKSDSEIQIPERCFLLMQRRISSRKRPRRSSTYQSYADEGKEGTGSEGEILCEDMDKVDNALVESNRITNSSSPVEVRNRFLCDGYTADNDEDSLLKLQAHLLQLKLDSKKRQAKKDKKSRENSKTRPRRSEKIHSKLMSRQSAKKKTSLSMYELDSDSWDSEQSLYFDPLTDGYYSPYDDESPIQGRARRVASLDESKLPSHRKSVISFYNKLRKTDNELRNSTENTDSEDTGSDENMAVSGSVGKKNNFRNSSKRNKTRKAVPLATAPRQSKLSSRWDEDDLSESDISLLTEQMQTSFKPKETQETNKQNIVYCEGQHCYRCGTFIEECEGTCTVCGTHCRRPDAPCTVCRDICERCGLPKVRCESRVKRMGTREDVELHARGIGFNHEQVEGDQTQGTTDKEMESYNDGKITVEDGGATSTIAAEDSFSTEITSNGQKSFKKERKLISKKRKKSGSRYAKRASRERKSTMDTFDSMETVTDQLPADYDEGDEIYDEEINRVSQSVQDDDFQSEKPQPSKYTKSNKKSIPSKQVISQTVIYRDNPQTFISQRSSSDQTIDDIQDEGDESGDETVCELEDDDKKKEMQVQLPTELSPQEDQKVNNDEQRPQKLETEKVEQLEVKKEVVDKQKEEDKPKPQIPKPKLRGVQRVNAAYKERVELNKRLQVMLKEALHNVIAEADIKVRRDSTIDYLAQYRLVDRSKIEVYGRAFTLEDEEEQGILNYDQMLLALEGIPTIQGMSRQQLNYVLQVLEIDAFSRVSFKMFAVITALCEKVTTLDSFVKELVDGLDLTQTEWKLDKYKEMFYVAGDRSVSFIKPDDLRIELKAGGLNQSQEDHVIRHITQSSDKGQITFLDYMAYIPLFLSIHKNICTNALDMSRDKYIHRKPKMTV